MACQRVPNTETNEQLVCHLSYDWTPNVIVLAFSAGLVGAESPEPWPPALCLQLPGETASHQAPAQASHGTPQRQRGHHRQELRHRGTRWGRVALKQHQDVCHWRLYWLHVDHHSYHNNYHKQVTPRCFFFYWKLSRLHVDPCTTIISKQHLVKMFVHITDYM